MERSSVIFGVGRKSLKLIVGRNSTEMRLVDGYLYTEEMRCSGNMHFRVILWKWKRSRNFSEQFVKMKTNFEYNSISTFLSALRVVLIKFIGRVFYLTHHLALRF